MAIQTRIKQRFDSLANWNQNDIVLLSGELAIVDCGQQIRFKVGDGSRSFTQLPFVDQYRISTKEIVAEAISQGLHASSVPYGLAAGAFLSANANFSQAFGYNAQTLSADSYSFVWNGDDTKTIGDYYNSNGKGTFSINPSNGISGFYVGTQNLAQILAQSGSKVFIDDQISGVSRQNDLSIIKLDSSSYASLLTSDSLLSNALYIVEDTFNNAYGRQWKNLAAPTDLSDAATKEYVDSEMSSKIPTKTSQLSNDSGFLTEHQSLSDYWTKSETSSSSEISDTLSELSEKIDGKILIDDRISNISSYSDLNIIKLSSDEYATLLTSNGILSNAIYIVEDTFNNAYGRQIKNLADPTLSSDAATKNYVDSSLSNVEIPEDLSAFNNSPGYLVSNDLSDYCYFKSETSSAIEISSALEQKSKVMFVEWED